MVRDTLSFQNPLDQPLSPFSPEGRTSGRDMLRSLGLISKRDTWLNMVPAMATEIALDPLTYLALGTTAGLTTAGKAARAAVILEHAPSIATAQRLGRPVEEVSSIWQKAGKVAESVRTGKGGLPKDWNVVVKEGEKAVLKPVPLIEQAQKKGWVPSG